MKSEAYRALSTSSVPGRLQKSICNLEVMCVSELQGVESGKRDGQGTGTNGTNPSISISHLHLAGAGFILYPWRCSAKDKALGQGSAWRDDTTEAWSLEDEALILAG